jgi:hypothetical protein
MADSEFYKEATAAGFTEKQARWLEENVAEEGHTHIIDDVEGLDEALGEASGDQMGDDDEGTG